MTYLINLSDRTLTNLTKHPELLTHEENKQVKEFLSWERDSKFLESNEVNEVPVPKGFTTLPHN